MYQTYFNNNNFFPNLLSYSIMTYDHITMTVTCDIILTLTLDPKNRK